MESQQHSGARRPVKTKEDQVRDLLGKTVESGATAGEEKVAVMKAYALVGQHGLEPGDFEWPARFKIVDGFVVPASAVASAGGTGRRGEGTIRALCESLIVSGKGTDDILKEVKDKFPDANTSKGCVAWYRSKMVKEGRLPKRAMGAAPATEPAAETA